MRTADRNHQVIETEEACGISTSNTAKKGRHREGGGVITRAGENIGTLRTFWVKGKSRLRLKKVVDRSGEGIHGRQKNMQMKVLDALQKIKAEDDSSLSYRRLCRGRNLWVMLHEH